MLAFKLHFCHLLQSDTPAPELLLPDLCTDSLCVFHVHFVALCGAIGRPLDPTFTITRTPPTAIMLLPHVQCTARIPDVCRRWLLGAEPLCCLAGFTPIDFILPVLLWNKAKNPSIGIKMLHWFIAVGYGGVACLGVPSLPLAGEATRQLYWE